MIGALDSMKHIDFIIVLNFFSIFVREEKKPSNLSCVWVECATNTDGIEIGKELNHKREYKCYVVCANEMLTAKLTPHLQYFSQ